MLGQEYNVLGDWFIIHFTENPGMAFGMVLEGEYGKLILSLFRIVAVSLIGWYLFSLIKKKANTVLIVSISLVLAGAIGNIIDSVIYGVVFTESYGEVAQFLSPEGGYSSFLHGRVVDMLYFPVVDTHLPSWFPDRPTVKPGWMPGFIYSAFPWANDHFMFFRPVFNIADAAISVGVAMILLFQRKFFIHENGVAESNDTPDTTSKLNLVSEQETADEDEPTQESQEP